MKSPLLAFLLSTSIGGTLIGCQVLPKASEQNPYKFAVIKNNSSVRFNTLSYAIKQNQLIIRGKITKRPMWAVVPIGHIDIAIFNDQGQLLAEATTNHIPKLQSARPERRNRIGFSAVINQVPEFSSLIKVAYHAEPSPPSDTPDHINSLLTTIN